MTMSRDKAMYVKEWIKLSDRLSCLSLPYGGLCIIQPFYKKEGSSMVNLFHEMFKIAGQEVSLALFPSSDEEYHMHMRLCIFSGTRKSMRHEG